MPDTLTIGEFSRMTHLSVKTLRHHHEVGLLEPVDVHPSTGYRHYTTSPDVSVIPGFWDSHQPHGWHRLTVPMEQGSRGARAGLPVAPATVWNILRKTGLDPAPCRTGQSWQEFCRTLAATMLACDFFTVDFLRVNSSMADIA